MFKASFYILFTEAIKAKNFINIIITNNNVFITIVLKDFFTMPLKQKLTKKLFHNLRNYILNLLYRDILIISLIDLINCFCSY